MPIMFLIWHSFLLDFLQAVSDKIISRSQLSGILSFLRQKSYLTLCHKRNIMGVGHLLDVGSFSS